MSTIYNFCTIFEFFIEIYCPKLLLYPLEENALHIIRFHGDVVCGDAGTRLFQFQDEKPCGEV